MSSLLGGGVGVLPESLALCLSPKMSSVGITANECTGRMRQAKCLRGSRGTMQLCKPGQSTAQEADRN